MISTEDLKRVSKLKGIKNIGHAEKDYIIDIILLSISRNTKDELVFKGGTCLYKFYGLDRFSQDIDFTARKRFDIDGLIKEIISDLMLFGIESEIKSQEKISDSIMITLKVKGPLYKGTPQSYGNIGIDINLRSSIDREPVLAKYNSFYEIPTFSLFIMSEEEILAEKIRAIMTRTKARDIYDLWFLLEKGIEFDEKLIIEKLKYYNREWNMEEFARKIDMKKTAWETELGPLIDAVPDIEKTKKSILDKISN